MSGVQEQENVRPSEVDGHPLKEGESDAPAASGGWFGDVKALQVIGALLGAATIALLISTIVLAVDDDSGNSSEIDAMKAQIKDLEDQNEELEGQLAAGQGPVYDNDANPCFGLRPDWPNVACTDETLEEIFTTGEQSGANVTAGYQGERNTTAVPITVPYRDVGLCPVNVHWHIGTEHYSAGEYDEQGDGPLDFHEGRQGFQCRFYDENDPKFTTFYDWQHCIGMTVGQTYEVHWPHSKMGMCNTIWQYQTPFYDGVFCGDLNPDAGVEAQVGVQSQTFVVVNDDSEEYYYGDLFSGMIVNADQGKGTDIAYYTGSTTGTQRNNEICSPFTPITWQVDRKCHLISASSFDEMCRVMKLQADNMGDDLYAHGSRELVADIHAANNQQRERERKLRRGN